MPGDASGRRTTRQIRASMAVNRARLEDDLIELEERIDDRLSPKRLLSRHPLLTSLAGALIGFVVVRRPSLVAKSLTRIAQLGAPFVLKALFARDERAPTEPS